MNRQNAACQEQILAEISKTRDVFTELDDFFRKFEGFREDKQIREVITQRHEAAKKYDSQQSTLRTQRKT